jgi:hypothetical protein
MTLVAVVDSYYYPSKWPNWIKYTELTINLIFICHYCLNLFISDNKIPFIFDYYSICEYISIIPTMTAIIIGMKRTDPPNAVMELVF